MTIADAAKEARALFSTNNPRKVWAIEDHENKPEWVEDMCYAAHGGSGGMFPDDYRYEYIVDALDAFEDCEDEDQATERMDEIEADIYTSDLTAWLNSRADRAGYCDEAVSDYGMTDCDTIQRIQLGQVAEKREVWSAVLEALKEHVQDIEDQEDASQSDEDEVDA